MAVQPCMEGIPINKKKAFTCMKNLVDDLVVTCDKIGNMLET